MTETIETYTADAPAPARELTLWQRTAVHLNQGSINKLRRGTKADQHSADALELANDAITRGYEAELVALVRAWRLERERGEG